MSRTARQPPKTGAERMAAHRARLRAKGLVPRTIWVPDLSAPDILSGYRRAAQAIAIAETPEREITGFLEQLEDWPDEVPEIEWPKKS